MPPEGALFAESRVPRTEAGERGSLERGSLRRQSAWRADTQRPHPAMGRSRIPRPPPLVLLLLMLSLWLALGAGKCRPCIQPEPSGAVGQVDLRVLVGCSLFCLLSLGNWSRKFRVSGRGWFPSLDKSMDSCRRSPIKSWPPKHLLAPGSTSLF